MAPPIEVRGAAPIEVPENYFHLPFPLVARLLKIGESFFLRNPEIRNISLKDTFETLKHQNICLQGFHIIALPVRTKFLPTSLMN